MATAHATLAKHSPLPWALDESVDRRSRGYIRTTETPVEGGDRGKAVAVVCQAGRRDSEMMANAAFIVRACNSHQEMVDELNEIKRALVAAGISAMDVTPLDDGDISGEAEYACKTTLDMVHDLIAERDATREELKTELMRIAFQQARS